MAEKKTLQSIVCRFFRKGNNRAGNNCKYRRNESTRQEPRANIAEMSSQRTVTSPSVMELTNRIESIQVSEDLTTTSEIVSSSTPNNEIFTESDASTGTFKPPVHTQAAVPSALATDRLWKTFLTGPEPAWFCKIPNCKHQHEFICEFCCKGAIYPLNEDQRLMHMKACKKRQAIKLSEEMSCGICIEKIIEKPEQDREFGILPNCMHCFCFICINKWKVARRSTNYIIQCPVCRVYSDFICPSRYWFNTEEEKDKFVNDYKDLQSKEECRYFKEYYGVCPYGIKCLNLHVGKGRNKTRYQ